MAQTGRFGLLLIAADAYAVPPGRLPSSDSARRLRDLLVARGGGAAEPIVVTTRNDVWSTLGRWAETADDPAPSSFVYLVGHGHSDGETHWFTLPETRGQPGPHNAIRTSTMADLLQTEWQHRQTDPASWVVLVLDCCASDVAVTNLMNELTHAAHRRPRRLALWPVTPQGASHSGRFVDALARCLETFTENDERIPLRELIRRMAPDLGGLEPDGSLPDEAALDNPRRAAATVTMASDAYAELRRAVDALPTEVRAHFLAKAQGAEVGELAWHFCGRERELASLASWLREADGGLRVVTGEAGSGKSALLGQLVVLADDQLVDALVAAKLMRAPAPEARPPAGAFDATIHLTGKTLTETVREVAEATGVARTMEDPRDPDAVIARLGAEPRRVTVLVDALDEAQEPTEIAGFLRRAAAADRVRVLAGTRRSVDEGPDRPADPTHRELLDALDADDEDLLVVTRDRAAAAEYAARRLLARESPYAGRDADVEAIAEHIAALDQPFLFTRLATAELLARPSLSPDDPALADLLGRGHRGVFAAAVERLRAEDPAIAVLLHVLALNRGRGFPEASGIWVAAARAIAPAGVAVPDAAVRTALERAAVYITLDGEAGQSTYRLAHQTFVEHFRAGPAAEPAHHRRIATALRGLVDREGGWEAANYYVVRYLPEHYVADADRVAPDRDGLTTLAVDAGWLRRALTLVGADRLSDVLSAAHRTARSFVVDAVGRAVRRSRVALDGDPDQLAAQLFARLKREDDFQVAALVAGLHDVAPDTWLRSRTWGLPWQADLDTTYTLVGTVRALAFGAVDGHTVLAIGVDDRVEFWNPRRGSAEARTLANEGRRVTAVALAELNGRPVAVVAAAYDGVLAVVDLRSGHRREVALRGPADSVAVGTLNGTDVVAAEGGGFWAWDARTLEPVDVGHAGWIQGVLTVAGGVAFHVWNAAESRSAVVDASSSRVVASMRHEDALAERAYASTESGNRFIVAARLNDRTRVVVWEGTGEGRHVDTLDFSPVPIRTLAAGTVDDRLVVAAGAEYAGTGYIVLRQVPRASKDAPPSLAAEVGTIRALVADRSDAVHALTSPPARMLYVLADGRLSALLAAGQPLTAEMTTWALTGRDEPGAFLTDSADSPPRLFEADDLGIRGRTRRGRHTLQRDDPSTWPATATSYASVRGRSLLAVGSYGGAVWLWDLDRRAVHAGPFAEVPESLTLPDPTKKTAPGPAPVTGVSVWPIEGRDVVATAHHGGVRLWDVDTQTPRPSPDAGTTRVIAVALGDLAGRAALVTGSEGGLLAVWDAATAAPIARIRLDARIDTVWVVRGADVVAALTEDRVLHLFDVVTRPASPDGPGP